MGETHNMRNILTFALSALVHDLSGRSVNALDVSCQCSCPAKSADITRCASSTLIAIDGSFNSASYWSSVIVEAKTIIKAFEKQRQVNFGIGEKSSQIGVIQFPEPNQHPYVLLSDYKDMTNMNSRDIRNYVTSAITAMLPANENADTNEILKRLIFDFEALKESQKPKIAIILTNGNAENQNEFEENAKKLQDLGVTVIPIALSRKCRTSADGSELTDDGFNCPNFGNLETLSSLDSNEVFSIGNSQIPHI